MENNEENTVNEEKNTENNNRLIDEKMEAELENLYQQLCRNLEENSQLNELFLRFFQTKTKLAFLFEEKEHKLILMKFLSFFNEFVIKINTSTSNKEKYNELSLNKLNYNYSPLKTFENFQNFPDIPYLSQNFYPFSNFEENNNNKINYPKYSPKGSIERNTMKNKGSPSNNEEKKVNFYGDLSNVDFKHTKYDPNKKDLCMNSFSLQFFFYRRFLWLFFIGFFCCFYQFFYNNSSYFYQILSIKKRSK